QLVSGAVGEVGRGLAAQRISGAGDHITGDRGDYGPVEGGKRPAYGHGRDGPRRKTDLRPSVAANGGWDWDEDQDEQQPPPWGARGIRGGRRPSVHAARRAA